MNNSTRRLQTFMRALRDTRVGSDLVDDVAANVARIDAERSARQSGLRPAVTPPRGNDE